MFSLTSSHHFEYYTKACDMRKGFDSLCGLVNRELVKNGLAFHYKKYSDDLEYSNLEINAQRKKLGIWSEN